MRPSCAIYCDHTLTAYASRCGLFRVLIFLFFFFFSRQLRKVLNLSHLHPALAPQNPQSVSLAVSCLFRKSPLQSYFHPDEPAVQIMQLSAATTGFRELVCK